LVVAVSAGLWMRRDQAAIIAARTAWALEHGDARTLLALASPFERDSLHLNESHVRRLLMHSLWRDGYPGPIRVTPERTAVANERQFELSCADGRGGWARSMHIMVAQRGPRDGWHLMLCPTIAETMAARPEPGHEKEGTYHRLEVLGKEMGLRGRVGVGYNLVIW
jgi:hypothetical protein